ATGNPELKKTGSIDESVTSAKLEINQKQSRSPVVGDLAQSSNYHPYLARATNDAVRDWDVKSGRVHWRQGLRSLFGYDSQPREQSITFWDERLHQADQARINASIGKAFSSKADHWSGEYRFRCCDGRYLQILERAFI